LPAGDGWKTVYVRFRDRAGNVSFTYSATITLDTVAPSGSITIDGDAIYAITTAVTLTLCATDSTSGLSQMQFSNDSANWSGWETYTTTKAWTLVGGDGIKTVYVQYRDNASNATVFSDTIILDSTPPSSAVSVLPTYQTTVAFTVSWTGSDAGAGLASYDVQVRDGAGGTWTDWLTYTTQTSATFNGADDHTYYFQCRARDTLGNLEPYQGGNGDTQTTIDVSPPNGSITINGGAFDTTSTNVQLTLWYTDTTSGVSQMALSNDGSIYTSWDSPATSRNWILPAGDGLKTVYVRYKDTAGNVSAVYTDTISLDTTVQPEFGLSINAGALFTNKITVTLSIGAQPGTAQMQVSNEGNFPGATWEPYTAHRSWQVTQYLNYVIPRLVYARYKDVNGSVSSTYLDDIIMDVNPPTGSVSIIGPSSARGLRVLATSVTLSLRAEDDVSGVGAMLISNRPDFAGAAWETYATSRGWTLDSNNTVYVRFRDNAGNVSATYSASRPSNWSVFLPLILK